MAIYNERIKQLRIDRDMTLKDIAKRLEITEATAQRYESGNGIKAIPYEKIVEYAKVFNVPPSYIMGWDESLRTANTDMLVQLALDHRKHDYVEKLMNLSEERQNQVFEYIDFQTEKEKGLK